MFDPSTLISLGRVEQQTVAPDGTWAAVVVKRLDHEHGAKYVSDIWRVDFDGKVRQLTRGRWNDDSVAFMADGALAFLSNRPTDSSDDSGHETRKQVFKFERDGGDPVCLTDEPLGVSAFQTARAGAGFCVAAPRIDGVKPDELRKAEQDRREHGPSALRYAEMPVRFWDHWLPKTRPHLIYYDADGNTQDLTPNAGREMLRAGWQLSADGSYVVVTPSFAGPDRIPSFRLARIDTASAQYRELHALDRGSYWSPVISPDGAKIAVIEKVRPEDAFGLPNVVTMDADGSNLSRLQTGSEIYFTPVAFSQDNATLYVVGPDRTHAPIFAIDTATGQCRRITADTDGGSHTCIELVGDRLVGIRSTSLHPPELFRCATSESSRPEIVAQLSGYSPSDTIVVENHYVESSDGAMVQYGVLRQESVAPHSPTLLVIHGGPISDWGDVWHWRWNAVAMAEAGHVVVMPNPRGSVGFGQEFVEGIWNNAWGGQCFEDLMAVADDVSRRSDVDASRMVAMGGSFGGYMTNWIGTQTDRFCALISHAGIVDNAAFHGVTDLPAFWSYQFGADPYAQRRDFDRYSPIEHIRHWRTPTLVIHGDLDYRVPISEALTLFEGLCANDVDAELLVFPDENHWILKPRNIVAWYDAVFDFIAKYAR